MKEVTRSLNFNIESLMDNSEKRWISLLANAWLNECTNRTTQCDNVETISNTNISLSFYGELRLISREYMDSLKSTYRPIDDSIAMQNAHRKKNIMTI